MKNGVKTFIGLAVVLLLSACINYFHDLIPPDDTLILSFSVDGQLGLAEITENSIKVTVEKGSPVHALVPRIKVSDKATLIPVTLDYVLAAFPSAEFTDDYAMKMSKSPDLLATLKDLIKATPDFNIPPLNIPIDFTGPITMLVVGGQGSTRQYTVNVVEDSGEPRILNICFSKYDNAELMSDALCVIDEANSTIYAKAEYPAEISTLSYALVPSFQILGESFEVDGNKIVSGKDPIQFSPGLGTKTKIITITRDEMTRDYEITVLFDEDKDSIRSITDFRFNKTANGDIYTTAVGSIINTDNTGTITVQVFYSGVKPSILTPSFISPGTVSVGGVTQTGGGNSHDFSSPVEYRVVSRNGMYMRIYMVKAEFINVAGTIPHITSFRFSAALNSELVQDAVGNISDGLILINAYYNGTTAPMSITPEFAADGIVTVYGSIQVSGASAQDFSRQVMYTVTNPEYPTLTLFYWVQCKMLRDTSSDAAITAFIFSPEENSNITDEIIGRIDQINGKISVYARPGSGTKTNTMYPRFTAAGKVSVSGTPQDSGISGRIFDAPVTYRVVSANGKNSRTYEVSVRELQSTIYVNCNAYGMNDGMSWKDAFISLRSACEAAADFPQDVPKEIWIAAGTYKPGNKAGDYFPLSSNTSYLGGFAGWETSKNQRNVAANTVTLSGDLGGGVKANRLFSLTITREEIRKYGDREYITYTYAPINGDLLLEDLKLRDASTYGIYATGNGDVEINNLDLQDISGSGIYFSGSFSSIKLSNITANNITGSGTFAVYLYGVQREVILKNSKFTNGRAVYAGTNSSNNTARIEISYCDFKNINGSSEAIYLYSSQGGYNTTIDRVNIDGVTDGKGISFSTNSSGSITISNSNIKNCKFSSWSGVINLGFSSGGTARISNTTIENIETTSGGGGGIYCYGGNLEMTGCTIRNVKARGSGGGVYFAGVTGGTFTMNGGRISNNTIGGYGGGVYVVGDNNRFIMRNGAVISDNTIINDSNGNSFGGGVYVTGGTFFMESGTISGNTVNQNGYSGHSWGGGVAIHDGGTFYMYGGTISNNKAEYGGGVFITDDDGGSSYRLAHFYQTGGVIYGSNGGAYANDATRTGDAVWNNDVSTNYTVDKR